MNRFEMPPAAPNQESPEAKLEKVRQACEKVNERLLAELQENFSEMEYHNPDHSVGVGDVAVDFLEELPEEQVSAKEKMIAKTIGRGHDIDQTYTMQPALNGIGMRRARETGAIEMRSGKHIQELLKEEGLELDEKDIRLIDEGVEGTIPSFEVTLMTVIQPSLTKESHPVTWAVAAADLGTAGRDPEHFLKDGDNVFNEDRFLPQLDTLDEETLKALYQEVIRWTNSQVAYAGGQKIYWNREEVPEFVKNKLTRFDESIKLCEDRAERRQKIYDESKSTKEN
ncbi:MAG: hypothetical protein AAB615_00180, partial [Patescibacteria group bacterium]